MSFINEKVSDEDIERFGLRAINAEYLKGDLEYYWTVDKARDVYVRVMGAHWQSPQNENISFYWKGSLLKLRLHRHGGGERGGVGYTNWSIGAEKGGGGIWLPPQLECYRKDIVDDLKEALAAYKDSGVFSTLVTHNASFNF